MLAQYGNSTEHESGTQDFCDTMDSIDQPDPDREQECPPEKGLALIMMSAWVMPMFIVPVSSSRFTWETLEVKVITISSLML